MSSSDPAAPTSSGARPLGQPPWAGLLHWAAATPDKPALIFGDRTIRYAELAEQTLRGAQYLRSLGLRTGDGIAVVAENHPDTLAIFWAAQHAGLAYTAISAQFQRDEVHYILHDCEAALLVASAGQWSKTEDAPQPHRIDIDRWRETIAHAPATLIDDPAEGAEMLYSSGTTGRPKGVRVTRAGAPLGTVSELFKRRVALHRISPETVYLSTAPLYHSAPLRYNAMVHRCGGTSVVMPKFDAEQSLALIERHGITHSQWVPTMFVRLLRLPPAVRAGYDLSSHQLAVHAAAPCPVDIKRQMLSWWGPIVHEYYSGTEGNGQTAIGPDEWLLHPGSVGRPVLGQVHIVAPDGSECPPLEPGLVYFEGGPRFEYFKDPEKTAGAYNAAGWSTLGDIGYVDAEGYLYLTDRQSHMIISGGVNIYPREVEDVLLAHPAVDDVAVFGVPNAEFGEEVKAAVQRVRNPDGQWADVSAEALIDWCRARLAHLKCPRSIDFHEALPRHQTGKIYKAPLKAAYWPPVSGQAPAP
jgi:acyl-CoA synthetase (AMP-forming)/AMP-acid ligase II